MRGPLPQRCRPTNAGGYVRERRDAMTPSCPPARMASPSNLDTRPDLTKPDIRRSSHGSPAVSVGCPPPNLDTPRRTVSTVDLQFPRPAGPASERGARPGALRCFYSAKQRAGRTGAALFLQGIYRDPTPPQKAGFYREIPVAGRGAATTISAGARLVPIGGALARSRLARRGSSPDPDATAGGAGPDRPARRAPATGWPWRRVGRHRGAGESDTRSSPPALVRRSPHRASIRRPP